MYGSSDTFKSIYTHLNFDIMIRLSFFLLIFIVNMAQAQPAEPDRTDYEKYESDAIYVMMDFGNSLGSADIFDANAKVLSEYVELQDLFANETLVQIELEFKMLANRHEKFSRIYRLKLSGDADKDALVETLSALRYIHISEKIPLYSISLEPDDPDYSNPNKRWHLDKIGAEDAWEVTQGCESIKIAVVDDAVMIDHEDLQANIYVNPGEIPNNGIDDDNNGYIDDVHGFDVADNQPNPSPPATAGDSYFSHGTHVAGIAAGVSDNGVGMASLGFNTSIIPIKTKSNSNQTPGQLTHPMHGVEYAITMDADIINMSWGSYAGSYIHQLVFEVAHDQNIVCVAAIGNDELPFSMYPAKYPSVISVVAMDESDKIATFSNFTHEQHVFAPGVNIWSATASSPSGYGFKSGTSMATGLVSGMIALMLCNNPDLDVAGIRHCINASATHFASIQIANFVIPRIYAAHAVLCSQPVVTAVEPGGCEMIINGDFELPKYADHETYSTYNAIRFGEVLGWADCPPTADILPLNVDAPNHCVHIFARDDEYEGIVTKDALGLVGGNTYKLEFDYSVTRPEAYPQYEHLLSIEAILIYNDYYAYGSGGQISDEFFTIGSIPYPTVDFVHGVTAQWLWIAEHPAPELWHHHTVYFEAPENQDLRKLVIHPTSAYPYETHIASVGLLLDNISLVPITAVEGVASDYTPYPDDCITLTAATGASIVYWEPAHLFDDPSLPVQEICLSAIETCLGGSYEFTVTAADSSTGCSSSDTVLVHVQGVDVTPPMPNVPILMEITVCDSLSYLAPPTAWDDCVGAVVGQGNQSFPIQESTTIVWTYSDSLNNVSTQEQEVVILNMHDPDHLVDQIDNTFTAVPGNASYQWIDCETGLAIENETNRSFSPSGNGLYAVEITVGHCVAVSACIAFVNVGIGEDLMDRNLTLLPNPTGGELRVSYEGGRMLRLEILDLSGKAVLKMGDVNGSEVRMDLSKLAGGVYILRVETDGGFVFKRVVKD